MCKRIPCKDKYHLEPNHQPEQLKHNLFHIFTHFMYACNNLMAIKNTSLKIYLICDDKVVESTRIQHTMSYLHQDQCQNQVGNSSKL